MTRFTQDHLYTPYRRPIVDVTDDPDITVSIGGIKFQELTPVLHIDIALCSLVSWDYFHEYEHIYKDEFIGDTEIRSPEHAVLLLLSHEFAHTIQHYHRYLEGSSYPVPRRFKSYKGGGRDHGRDWQFLYRIIRQEFC